MEQDIYHVCFKDLPFLVQSQTASLDMFGTGKQHQRWIKHKCIQSCWTVQAIRWMSEYIWQQKIKPRTVDLRNDTVSKTRFDFHAFGRWTQYLYCEKCLDTCCQTLHDCLSKIFYRKSSSIVCPSTTLVSIYFHLYLYRL